MSDPNLTQLEQRYGLPPGILAATRHVESRGDTGAVSSKGARGPFQLMPDTARALGVNPHDPMQAAEGAARLWRQNLDAAKGDIDLAARMYQGGPDRSKWGPQNAAYPGQILAALRGRQAESPPPPQRSRIDDYIDQASGNSSPQGGAIDTYLSIARDAMGSPDGNAPSPSGQTGGQGDRGSGAGDSGNDSGGTVPTVYGGIPQRPGQVAGNQGGLREGTGQEQGESRAQAFARGLGNLLQNSGKFQYDAALGALGSIDRLAGTAETLGARGLDALGLTDNLTAAAEKDAASAQQFIKDRMFNPEGWGQALGGLGGDIATFEASGLSKLAPFGEASKLARALNYGAQGAIAGAAMSGGRDVLQNAALGGVLGPVGGAAAEVVGPTAARLGKALASRAEPYVAPVAEGASRIANALKQGGEVVDTYAPRGLVEAEAPYGRWANGAPKTAQDVAAEAEAANGGGLVGEVTDDRPAPSLVSALKAAGAKQGIEATPALPKAANDDFEALVAAGQPEDQALNEAAIKYVGGKPTVGTVTRDFNAQEAEREGAKLATPEGAALRQRQVENNAALHNTAQETVNGYGGIPAQGEAAEAAAMSLAKASDAAKAQVSEMYAAARAQDGDQRASIDGLRELLAKPSFKSPTTNEGRALVTGLRRQIAAMAKENGGRFTPDEIDQLTQSANAAYNPMGGGANNMVGEIKAALSESLDQFDKAGPAYKAARAAHRQWAQQFDDPAGIERLIKRDAAGNFLNADNWRQTANGLIGTTSDKAFIQVVRQLQKTGDETALAKLKAEIVQRAYQNATKSATTDSLGNSNFSAKAWETALNQIGLPKLKALFSPEELAHLATIGRAARAINEAVPGSVNTSNTASKLANALKAANDAEKGKTSGTKAALGQAVKSGLHVAVGSVAPGTGNAALATVTEAASRAGSSAAKAKASKALAKAMQEALDPALARQAANDDALTAEAKSANTALAKALAKRAAPAAATRRKD